MRIIVWGINYLPEVTGIAPFNRGMCRFLSASGHNVSMVSSFAYYPAWRKDAKDRRRLFRTDVVEGIPVHRCWHYVPARATTLLRILHEFSFGIVSFLRVLSLPRPDLYIIISPPLILGPLARLACWFKRSNYVFHVQDLQPDAALGLGMVSKDGILAQALHHMAALAYKHASLVSGISRTMVKAFAEKSVPLEKQYWFPNWVEIDRNGTRPAGMEGWRTRNSIPEDAFLASYSGNLGRKQGLEVLLDTAELLEEAHRQGSRQIIIVIVGDGTMRPILEARLRLHPLSNIRLLPLLPEADYRGMMSASDICLITQSKGTGQFFLPSKLLSMLVAGKPVAVASDETSELARAVRQGRFGLVVPPENPQALAKALTGLAASPSGLVQFGLNGSRWVVRFEADLVLGKFERRLRELPRNRLAACRA
jgi:colanic acid biosynthesis glycosyl transferase WcaI